MYSGVPGSAVTRDKPESDERELATSSLMAFHGEEADTATASGATPMSAIG